MSTIPAPPKPKPLQISTLEFFTEFYPNFNGQHHLEIRKLPGGHQTFCRSAEEASMAANDQTRNVYFGLSLRDGKHGDEEHASLLPVLFADVDAKDFEGGKQAAAESIAKFEFGPSVVIDSGGGYHSYWLLKEPEEITDGNRTHIKGILRGVAGAVGGDVKCAELARILRVPGTLNLKDPTNKLPVTVIRWHPERRYNLDDFDHYHVSEPTHQNTASLPAGEADPSRISWKTKDFLAIGTKDGGRNHMFFAAACDLKGCGYPLETATRMLLGGAASCQPPLAEAEAKRTIQSAWNGERGPARPEPKEQVEDSNGNNSDNPNDSDPYKVIDGATYRVKPVVRQGEVVGYDEIRLCNFNAKIIDEVERDNGVEISRVFGVEGGLDCGRVLGRIEVGANEFGAMNWPVAKWGARARLSAGMSAKDRLRDAIQTLSINSGIDTRTVYTHTGWRRTKNGWMYLHAGGSFGANDVEVDLESPLNRYVLPDPEDVADAVGLSMALLDVAPRSVTIPLLASAYLAPLCEWLRPDFALWLFGTTGAMKTTLAALFSGHFGDFPDKNALPGSWESTGNALEKTLFILKDTMAVIDDYAPQSDPSAQKKVERAVSQVVRSAGNLSGRSRMKSDTTLRASYPPRGLMVATGEDIPTTQSLLARLLTVEIEQGAVDKLKLTTAQERAHRLPHAMAGYIEWLVPQMDRLGDKLRSVWQERRSEASKGAPHLRVPEQVAFLTTGFDTFLKFAVEVGVITDTQSDRLYEEAWDILLKVGQIHGRRVVEVDPAERFLNVLSSLFASESVYVDAKDFQRHPGDPKPHGDMIGWGDGEFLYLIPDATRAAIATTLRAAGDHWPHSANALYRALDKRGILAKGKDKALAQAKIHGKNRRVLRIARLAIEEEPVTRR